MSTSLFHGLLVLDKPAGMTSRAAVDRALDWFPRGTRIGHTGTLDPLATGVLVLTVGVATRLAEYVQRMEKIYRTTIRLGATSDSDDAEGTITPAPAAELPDRQAVDRVIQQFVGEIDQVPPAFSAVSVTGQRAYRLARRGKELALPARKVRIHTIEVLAYDYPRLELEVRCGKGTYIRALARDIGQRLACGGYVEALRRMRVGPFTIEQAIPLEADAGTAATCSLPLCTAVVGMPRLALTKTEADQLCKGRKLPLAGLKLPVETSDQNIEAAIHDSDGQFVAIAAVDFKRELLRPTKVLAKKALA